MLSHAGAVVIAALAVTLSASPAAVAEDEPPVIITPGYGVVDTQVTDAGAQGVADSSDRGRGLAPAPTRTCTTTKSPTLGPIDANDALEWGGAPRPGPGGWLTRTCSDGTTDMAWVALDDAPPAAVAATPEQLARQATNRLRLPLGEPRFNPSRESSAGRATLVSIPTWFWVDDVAAVAQRTSAGDVWARVSASPTSVSFYPGDGGGPVRCAGAGTPWSPGAASSSCTYTYSRSSAAQPGNVYTARAVVTWRVMWEGAGGLNGTLPLMQRQVEFPIAVAERQTVVTSGGGR